MSYGAIRVIPGIKDEDMIATLKQNFDLIENELDIYKIIDEYQFDSTSVPAYSNVYQTDSVDHDLNKIPFFDAFIDAYGTTNGNTITSFGDDYIVPYVWAVTIPVDNLPGGGTFVAVAMTYYIGVDKEKIYFARKSLNTTATAQTAPASKVYYYIQRQNVDDLFA